MACIVSSPRSDWLAVVPEVQLGQNESALVFDADAAKMPRGAGIVVSRLGNERPEHGFFVAKRRGPMQVLGHPEQRLRSFGMIFTWSIAKLSLPPS
jgi:hypothetical protein